MVSPFEEAYKYHFDKARTKFRENNRPGAASEIRKAASFVKLKAAHTGNKAKTELDIVIADLKKLTTGVEDGAVKDLTELNQAFDKAVAALEKKK